MAKKKTRKIHVKEQVNLKSAEQPKNSSDKQEQEKKLNEKKLFAFLATFLSILGFVIALIAKRDDEYVMFYAAQSLVIFIISIISGIIQFAFGWIPLTGWLLSATLNLIVIAAWIISWVYALSGEKKDVPYVGQWAKKISL